MLAVVLSASGQLQSGGSGGAAAVSVASPATSVTNNAANKLKFDAASVRPSSRKFVLIGLDFLDPVREAEPPKGGLFSWNVQLSSLIDFAYDLRSPQVERSVWEGIPRWAQSEWYAVEARAEGNPARAEVREMVRSLLEERFQFAGHVEKRDGQVYALVVAESGSGTETAS